MFEPDQTPPELIEFRRSVSMLLQIVPGFIIEASL